MCRGSVFYWIFKRQHIKKPFQTYYHGVAEQQAAPGLYALTRFTKSLDNYCTKWYPSS
jgi:hypothetical protein